MITSNLNCIKNHVAKGRKSPVKCEHKPIHRLHGWGGYMLTVVAPDMTLASANGYRIVSVH